MATRKIDALDRAILAAVLRDRGCLALAFGMDRGGLTGLGVLVARRVGHRPEGVPITVETMPEARAKGTPGSPAMAV